ncbi:Unknown protein sequence [Pseudomonas coronafaciens pv. oryzae]|nr:Unknown protein sequence [Pseudomonas coronafaciens pv. oryzae]
MRGRKGHSRVSSSKKGQQSEWGGRSLNGAAPVASHSSTQSRLQAGSLTCPQRLLQSIKMYQDFVSDYRFFDVPQISEARPGLWCLREQIPSRGAHRLDLRSSLQTLEARSWPSRPRPTNSNST